MEQNFLNYEDYGFLCDIKNKFKLILDEFSNSNTPSNPYYEFNLHNGKWEIIILKKDGIYHPINKKIFPVISGIFQPHGSKIHICGFSILNPGCEIYEHVGNNDKVLRCHLCLTSNQDCAIVVNGETKKWKIGEFLIFDDTKIHSAYNRGNTPRIVVLFDFYK